MENFEYFSQHGQDKFIFESFFRDVNSGFFVDIGAYDGRTLSNTYFFEKYLGWQGICIEPLNYQYERLALTRNSICINACVSNYEGYAVFCEVGMPNFGHMYSGLVKNYDARHRDIIDTYGTKKKEYNVAVMKLSKILEEYNVDEIDYCSIDTEGSEQQIMEDIKEGGVKINVLSIENNYRDIKLHNLIESCGFFLAHTFSGFDDLYVRKGWKEERMSTP